MPKGYRGVTFAAFGCLGFSTLGQAQQTYQVAQARDTQARDRSEQSRQAFINHAGVPSLAEQLVSNPEPKNTTERENRDLAAQENVAVWGFWSVFVGGVQAILSAVGILFIIRTLRQNDRSLAIADSALAHSKQSVEIDMRPWLEVAVEAEGLEVSPLQISLNCTINITNIGKTPARNVRFEAQLFEFSVGNKDKVAYFFDHAHVEGFTVFAKDRTILPRAKTKYQSVVNRRFEPPEFDPGSHPTFYLILAVNATYEWANSDARAQTSASFYCRRIVRVGDEDELTAFGSGIRHVNGADIDVVEYEHSKIN